MNTIQKETTCPGNARPNVFMLPILKLPRLLYRAGFGRLFGHRFMLLTHIGRYSGKVRQTVLAVLRFDPKTNEIMAISAWSESDWYKNILVSPALQVEIGLTRFVPMQRSLLSEEIATLFEDYRRMHPLFSRIVCQIPGWKWDSSHDEWLELAHTLQGVAFRPKPKE